MAVLQHYTRFLDRCCWSPTLSTENDRSFVITICAVAFSAALSSIAKAMWKIENPLSKEGRIVELNQKVGELQRVNATLKKTIETMMDFTSTMEVSKVGSIGTPLSMSSTDAMTNDDDDSDRSQYGQDTQCFKISAMPSFVTTAYNVMVDEPLIVSIFQWTYITNFVAMMYREKSDSSAIAEEKSNSNNCKDQGFLIPDCKVCAHKYHTQLQDLVDKTHIPHRLPVSCFDCGEIMCYSCVMKQKEVDQKDEQQQVLELRLQRNGGYQVTSTGNNPEIQNYFSRPIELLCSSPSSPATEYSCRYIRCPFCRSLTGFDTERPLFNRAVCRVWSNLSDINASCH